MIQDSDDEYFNGLRNSTLLKTARKNPLKQQTNYYEKDVIEQSLKKSYIFKMATKGRKTNANKKIFTEQSNGMTRSKIIKKKNNIKDNQRTLQKLSQIVFYIKNIGNSKSISFNCCQHGNLGEKSMIKFPGNRQLEIYDESKTKLRFGFNFDTIKAKIKSDFKTDGFVLKFDRNLQLCFQCPEDFQALLKLEQVIKGMISKSDGQQYKLTSLFSVKPHFYQKRYKTAVQFAQSCKTGDILLFQGSHFFANVQRFITNSDYDHIGMVIKDPVYGVLIFESNSTSGVCLTPWQYLVKYSWYEAIQRIVWRKLQNVQRDNDFQLLIHEFVKANLGKNYFISFDKLISNKSYIATKQEEVGYFCSQLVAKLYKDLGLLTRNPKKKQFKPSCNFYPYHFSERFSLQLSQGELSKQYEIYFNKEALNKFYSAQ